MQSKTTTNRPSAMAVGLACELYDRFVMGGWEPQDAHSLIDDILSFQKPTQQMLPNVLAEGHQQFWVYTPIGRMFVMAHRLEPDDEMYERGFKRVDYDGLCEFEYWLDAPAIPIIKPEMQNVRT